MKPQITCEYIGHATTHLTIGANHILTDPHFGKRTLFFKRRTELRTNPAELPKLAAILISHTHFDHLNIGSYKYISQKVPIIVPEGCHGAIGNYVANPIIELSLFATHELQDGVVITALPAKHRGGRYSQLRFTKANSYLIQKDESCVFFTGDSAYGPHFQEIGNLAKIDLALLPISGYSPRWIMVHRHMTPAETIQAFEDLKAEHMIPIHWSSFSLSLEPPNQPIEWLQKILQERPELSQRVHILANGEKTVIT
jgi:L-ascorbate metabolism protein UlaG (beta-lactamase superfamily)